MSLIINDILTFLACTDVLELIFIALVVLVLVFVLGRK